MGLPLAKFFEPNPFSSSELLQSLLPARTTLQHISLYSSPMKLQLNATKIALGPTLDMFPLLTTLFIDEQRFCHHWLRGHVQDKPSSELDLDPVCLIAILPRTISSLTVRLHGRYAAGVDVIHLGHKILQGCFPALSTLQVQILNDMSGLRMGLHAGSWAIKDCLLYHVPPEDRVETLKKLARELKLRIEDAFLGTGIQPKVRYNHSYLFPSADDFLVDQTWRSSLAKLAEYPDQNSATLE